MENKNILPIIEAIRNSFVGAEHVYTSGSCYYFAKILESIFPAGELYEIPHIHVVFKLYDKFYDITGELADGGTFVPSPEPTRHGKFDLVSFITSSKNRVC